MRSELVETALLVLSELATTALDHQQPLSCGQYEVAWCLDFDALRISMHDGREPALLAWSTGYGRRERSTVAGAGGVRELG